MATMVVQPATQVLPLIPRISNLTRRHCLIKAIHPWIKNRRIYDRYRPIWTTKASDQQSSLVGNDHKIVLDDKKTLSQLKAELYQAVQGLNRGVFGVPSAKKSEIEGLVKLLESKNPTSDPTVNLDKVVGCWKLVYCTITILGSKRTKLGLRDFITLGDFFQNIDVAKGKAVNVIKFNVRGLNMLSGQLKIEASFKIASKSRVDIKYECSTITPDQLMNMFQKNYDLLLSIFNPEGWLEITYVDDELRIGRDDNGNIFILERWEQTESLTPVLP